MRATSPITGVYSGLPALGTNVYPGLPALGTKVYPGLAAPVARAYTFRCAWHGGMFFVISFGLKLLNKTGIMTFLNMTVKLKRGG